MSNVQCTHREGPQGLDGMGLWWKMAAASYYMLAAVSRGSQRVVEDMISPINYFQVYDIYC